MPLQLRRWRDSAEIAEGNRETGSEMGQRVAVTVQPYAILDGMRRKHIILRGYAPQAGRGRATAHAPYRPQFAISNPLRLSRMTLRLAHLICSLASSFAPFTGWRSFRAPRASGGSAPVPRSYFYISHSAPITRHPWRGIGAPATSCRRNAFGLIMTACGRNVRSVQMRISRIKSSLGLNRYRSPA